MDDKHFIFQEGCWLGQGTIILSTSAEELPFYMRWRVEPEEKGTIHCVQEIELQGVPDKMVNHYIFNVNKSPSKSEFPLRLENDILGKIGGKGLIDKKLLAWEFRDGSEFEGVEVYEQQPEGSYLTRAEYLTADQYRTTIRGKLWKQEAESY